MKEEKSSKWVDQWLASTVENPSSEFQKRSEDWLRDLRTSDFSNGKHNFSRILKWSIIPVTAAIVLMVTINLQQPLNQNLPAGMSSKDFSVFKELVEMDNTLGSGTVLFESDQLDTLNALSNLPIGYFDNSL